MGVILFLKHIYKGKTLGRFLFNRQVYRDASLVRGRILDLAGSKKASYVPFFSKECHLVSFNIMQDGGVDIIGDVNKPLPFPDLSFDTVLFFNALYILKERSFFLKEVLRVIRPGGVFILSSPFIANEMPEPHDFCRLTKEGIETELRHAGFNDVNVMRIGERFSAATNLLHPAWVFNTVRLIVYSIALFFDRLIPVSVQKNHPTPISYFVKAQK